MLPSSSPVKDMSFSSSGPGFKGFCLKFPEGAFLYFPIKRKVKTGHTDSNNVVGT